MDLGAPGFIKLRVTGPEAARTLQNRLEFAKYCHYHSCLSKGIWVKNVEGHVACVARKRNN